MYAPWGRGMGGAEKEPSPCFPRAKAPSLPKILNKAFVGTAVQPRLPPSLSSGPCSSSSVS